MTNFEKVSKWIFEKKGTEVKLGQVTLYFGKSLNRIFIHHNMNLEKNGLFALLHECGHALQPNGSTGVNRYKKIDEDRFPKKHKMLQFINEVDAWEKGLQIAEELGIQLDMKAFNKLKEESLMTYF